MSYFTQEEIAASFGPDEDREREEMARLLEQRRHTEACWAMPECTVCARRKKPYGRDPGVVAANGYCGSDCPGYHQAPLAGHFWPGEKAEDVL